MLVTQTWGDISFAPRAHIKVKESSNPQSCPDVYMAGVVQMHLPLHTHHTHTHDNSTF